MNGRWMVAAGVWLAVVAGVMAMCAPPATARDVCEDRRVTGQEGAAKLAMCCAEPDSCRDDAFWREVTARCCPDDPAPCEPVPCVVDYAQISAVCRATAQASCGDCNPELLCNPTLVCDTSACEGGSVCPSLTCPPPTVDVQLVESVSFGRGLARKIKCAPPVLLGTRRQQACRFRAGRKLYRLTLDLGPVS